MLVQYSITLTSTVRYYIIHEIKTKIYPPRRSLLLSMGITEDYITQKLLRARLFVPPALKWDSLTARVGHLGLAVIFQVNPVPTIQMTCPGGDC